MYLYFRFLKACAIIFIIFYFIKVFFISPYLLIWLIFVWGFASVYGVTLIGLTDE